MISFHASHALAVVALTALFISAGDARAVGDAGRSTPTMTAPPREGRRQRLRRSQQRHRSLAEAHRTGMIQQSTEIVELTGT